MWLKFSIYLLAVISQKINTDNDHFKHYSLISLRKPQRAQEPREHCGSGTFGGYFWWPPRWILSSFALLGVVILTMYPLSLIYSLYVVNNTQTVYISTFGVEWCFSLFAIICIVFALKRLFSNISAVICLISKWWHEEFTHRLVMDRMSCD